MKRFVILSTALFTLSLSKAQVVADSEVRAEWVVVKGTASSFENDPRALEQMAQREAIQFTLGSSITFSDVAREYDNDYNNHSLFVEVRSELLDGVWKGNKTPPTFYSETAYIESTEGKRKRKAEKYYCEGEGYAARIKTMPVAFEYKVTDQLGSIVAQHPEQSRETKIAYNQNDQLIVEFRTTQSGHLTLFLDDGNAAYRLLPYSYYASQCDMEIEAQKLYRLFDPSAAAYGLQDYVDEIVMATDLPLDAFRLYFIFSQTPFSSDFFLSDSSNNSLAEGVTPLLSIESREFARWLQQSRMLKDDLQVAIVDLMIENRTTY